LRCRLRPAGLGSTRAAQRWGTAFRWPCRPIIRSPSRPARGAVRLTQPPPPTPGSRLGFRVDLAYRPSLRVSSGSGAQTSPPPRGRFLRSYVRSPSEPLRSACSARTLTNTPCPRPCTLLTPGRGLPVLPARPSRYSPCCHPAGHGAVGAARSSFRLSAVTDQVRYDGDALQIGFPGLVSRMPGDERVGLASMSCSLSDRSTSPGRSLAPRNRCPRPVAALGHPRSPNLAFVADAATNGPAKSQPSSSRLTVTVISSGGVAFTPLDRLDAIPGRPRDTPALAGPARPGRHATWTFSYHGRPAPAARCSGLARSPRSPRSSSRPRARAPGRTGGRGGATFSA